MRRNIKHGMFYGELQNGSILQIFGKIFRDTCFSYHINWQERALHVAQPPRGVNGAGDPAVVGSRGPERLVDTWETKQKKKGENQN